MTPQQQAFIDKTLAAAERCEAMAREADKLNLPILARDWSWLGGQLAGAVTNQVHQCRYPRQAVLPSATLPEKVTPAGPQTLNFETVEEEDISHENET